MDDLILALGYFAATLTTIAFVPQVLKCWRTRSTRDISLGMFLVFSIGIAGWLAYGILTVNPPIIAANVATLIMTLAILVMKIRFDGLRAEPAGDGI